VAEVDADLGTRCRASPSSPPAPPMIIEQIKAQLDRLVPVHKVTDLTMEGPAVERELALVKVAGTGDKRIEALRLADVFRARSSTRRSELHLRDHRRREKIDASSR
jgi:acetolactate synthase-1/3 small subunit